MASLTSFGGESKKNKTKKTNKQTLQCGICCEDCNHSDRKAVNCPYCDLCACRKCVKYYITSKTDVANCMGCNKPWDRKFVQDSLTKSYFNGTWKKHRKNMLFETEQARFPDTMYKVEQIFQIRKYEDELKILKEQEDKALLIWRLARNESHEMQCKINNIKYNRFSGEKRQFIKKCPVDDCTGFLSTGYKCGLCEVKVCSKCHEAMGYTPDCKEQHECDPNTVAAIDLIKLETKPCPQCVAPIYKISGCDQMWCTSCNIAFSWRSGLKVTGTIHNPHYYEFMRQNGGNGVQNPGAVNCGGLPNYNQINIIISKLRKTERTLRKWKPPAGCSADTRGLRIQFVNNIIHHLTDAESYLSTIHRGVLHFQHTILDPIRRDIQTNRDNEDLRVKFMMKELGEEQFKTNLIRRDNIFEKKQALLHIYELMGNVFVETTISIYNLAIELSNKLDKHRPDDENLIYCNTFIEEFQKQKQNLDKVRRYCNKELVKISLIYNQVVDIINDVLGTSTLKKQECQKIMKLDNYIFIPMRDKKDNRILYTEGKTWRSRRVRYQGLDE
jgi:hypothetical protein